MSQVEYLYDAQGNITEQKVYRDDVSDYDRTTFEYTNGYLTAENHHGVFDTDGGEVGTS